MIFIYYSSLQESVMNEYTTTLAREKLKKVFGHKEFRGIQEAVIKNVLEDKNTFAVMPTGGGKSLCYQIPALIKPGVAIVISPLIALMKNQVDQLLSLGISATFLNSTLYKKDIKEIKSRVLSGKIKLLYVAPESLTKTDNIKFLKQAQLSFMAVDEAHCISDWGHDFRPEYRNVRAVVDQELNGLPIIALTATATLRVQQDILNNLRIRDATLFRSSFNRKNLYYEVRDKNQVRKQLIRFVKDHPRESGIVYCQNRRAVEELANLLNVNGIQAVPYHAGLEAKIRIKNQDAFLNKKVDVIVATIAFGMGIDKPDIRFVIHHDIPKSLEGYYQETGRAGRDGLKSVCLMFYNAEDYMLIAKLNKGKPEAEQRKAQHLLQEMNAYALSGTCRRRQLLYYFGEKYKENCNYCDNCKKPTETYPGETYIKMILTTIHQIREQGSMQYVVQILRGIEDSSIRNNQYQKLPTFGKGSEQDEDFWESVIRQMLLMELLSRDITYSDCLKITEKGKKFLEEKQSTRLYYNHNYTSTESEQHLHTPPNQGETQESVLLDLLKDVRKKVAQERGIPEYAVLQETSLEEMALVCPISLETLTQISGLSKSKAEKFGAPFVQLIQQYVEDNDIVISSKILVKSVAKRSENRVHIIQQVDRKVDLKEIAEAKLLSMDMLLKEMEQLCHMGTKLNIDYYINTVLTEDQQKEVYDYFMQAKTDDIELALAAMDGEFEEEELRLMRIKFLSEVAN